MSYCWCYVTLSLAVTMEPKPSLIGASEVRAVQGAAALQLALALPESGEVKSLRASVDGGGLRYIRRMVQLINMSPPICEVRTSRNVTAGTSVTRGRNHRSR